jgi:hypothetical protein
VPAVPRKVVNLARHSIYESEAGMVAPDTAVRYGRRALPWFLEREPHPSAAPDYSMMRSNSSKAYVRGDAVTHTTEGVHCVDSDGFREQCKLSSVMTTLLQNNPRASLDVRGDLFLVWLNAKQKVIGTAKR